MIDNEDTPEVHPEEAWYDAEIAPALAELAKRCNEKGMAFVAAVEFMPGNRGGTYFMTKDAGLEMHMLHICARTAPNVDSYIINLKRHCHREGIDTQHERAAEGGPLDAPVGRGEDRDETM